MPSLGFQAKPSLGKVEQKMKELRKPCDKAEGTNAVWTVPQVLNKLLIGGRGWGMEGTKGAGKWTNTQAKTVYVMAFALLGIASRIVLSSRSQSH